MIKKFKDFELNENWIEEEEIDSIQSEQETPNALTFTSEINIDDVITEDGGLAKYVSLSDDEDNGVFIELKSWDENSEHEDFNKLVGHKVRVTIEIIE